MELEGKRVIIVGLGKSGVAAARLCVRAGADVIGNDRKTAERLGDGVRELGIELVLGGHDTVPFAEADLVVVSPGVPVIAELERAERAGTKVIGELELASRFTSAPILCVGGTNGKSTTTTLLGELLTASGLNVFVGGNLGTPLCEAIGNTWDALVLEVSSFQLERAPTFHPVISVLLNVTEDHLDRYPSFQAYADAKGNAFVNQTEADTAIVGSDPECERQARRGEGRLLRYGWNPDADYVIENRSIVERSSRTQFDLGPVNLHGRHNLENAAAAIAAARSFGAGAETLHSGLSRFQPLPHRMALAGTVGGVSFYDDSKGTNVGASVTALLGLPEPRVVLIAGGRDKHGSYAALADALSAKGRALVVIGEAAERIAAAVQGRVPVEQARSMPEAVRRAHALARPGDAVLLSPACSSFDMFENYADRGDRFVQAVRELAAGGEA
jgi:UDP-N-acetylmuramoylalanine--D-glutamate ligase